MATEIVDEDRYAAERFLVTLVDCANSPRYKLGDQVIITNIPPMVGDEVLCISGGELVIGELLAVDGEKIALGESCRTPSREPITITADGYWKTAGTVFRKSNIRPLGSSLLQ
jgi:hypothetical protein